MIREWLAARRARLEAARLQSQVQIAARARIATIMARPFKSAGELMEMRMLSEGILTEAFEPSLLSRQEWLKADLQRILDFQRGGYGTRFTDKNRKDGADFPFFASEEELARHRDYSRLIVATNDNARGLLGGLRRYTFGTGMTVSCVPKEENDEYLDLDMDGADDTGDLADQATKWLNDFCDKNRMAFKSREFFSRSRRDGEGIFRLFDNGDGTAKVRFVWPEQIRQPPGTDIEEWSFGRQVDPDDVETTIAWAIWLDHDRYVTVPDEEIIYLGPNADSGVKRSLPDFCLGTGEVLDAANKLANNAGECAAQQAAIAYIRQHIGQTKDTIQQFISADADYTIPNLWTGQDRKIKHAEPGTIIDTNENTQYLPSPFSSGIPGYIEVFQMLVRRVASRYNAPEWLGTSYSQEVNFASSLTAESPFVLTILEIQDETADALRTLLERVLLIAARAGHFPADILDQIEVKVTFPNPRVRDGLVEAQRAQIELQLGITSPQREAELAGREFNEVQKELQEAEAMGWVNPASAGQMNGDGQGGDQMDGDEEGEGEPEDLGYDVTVEPADEETAVTEGLFEELVEAGYGSNYTGSLYGRYYISGRQVSRSEYLAQSKGKEGAGKGKKMGKRAAAKMVKDTGTKAHQHLKMAAAADKAGDRETAKKHRQSAYGYNLAGMHHEQGDHDKAENIKKAIPIALPIATRLPDEDPRHNPTLDALFAEPAEKQKEGGQNGDIRHNPTLDAMFGMEPNKAGAGIQNKEYDKAHKWAQSKAQIHAATVAQHLGLSAEAAHAKLTDAIRGAAMKGGESVVLRGENGKRIKLTVKRKVKPGAAANGKPMAESHDVSGEPRDWHGRWTASLRGHIDRSVKDHYSDEQADEVVEHLSELSREDLHKVVQSVGITEARPHESKTKLLRRVHLELTAARRSKERAEV